MTQKEEDFQNYKNTLKCTDWAYQYSDDPTVFRMGQKKMDNAWTARRKMCLSYPEDREKILKLWENRGIE